MAASWVLRETLTGRVICETFDPKKVAALNTARYEAVPILQHLQGLNRAVPAEHSLTAQQVAGMDSVMGSL